MHFRSWLLSAVALFILATPLHASEGKKGRPDLSGLPLWNAKGMTLIRRQHVPGLNGALLLTYEQIDRLYTAWRETVDSPELLEQGRKVKLNPNTTDEQRREHQRQYEAAHGRLQTRVASILTPAQKELMGRIEVIHGQAEEAAGAVLLAEITQAKASGNAQEVERVLKQGEVRLAEEFRQRLTLILTPEQRAAMEANAAEEERREAEAAAAPKSK